MTVVLKENEWAEEMIQANDLGKKPSETLRRVARYYLDKGYSPTDTRKRLDSFLVKCEPTYSLSKWSDTLDHALTRALKYNAIKIDSIDITKPEMNRIDSLEGKQTKRLAFTLLCLAKYWKIVMPDGDNWVNNKDSEIMALANINTSIKRQGLMYWTLREAGMVQFSKKVDNTNVRVCFAEDGKVVLHITDFRNLGYQYLMYHGEPYFECVNCGITNKINNPKNNRKPKYCSECAAKIHMQQAVNSVMRLRYNSLSEANTALGVYIVYMHQCPNKKRYIGMTSTSLYKRWKNGTGYIDNQPFFADIQKYGWENIKHYKIAIVQDKNLAKDIESYYIQKYKTSLKENGYNRISGKLAYRYDESIVDQYTPVEVDKTGHRLT